jgi:hypothetical protein
MTGIPGSVPINSNRRHLQWSSNQLTSAVVDFDTTAAPCSTVPLPTTTIASKNGARQSSPMANGVSHSGLTRSLTISGALRSLASTRLLLGVAGSLVAEQDSQGEAPRRLQESAQSPIHILLLPRFRIPIHRVRTRFTRRHPTPMVTIQTTLVPV